jgi:hypothetical protein
MGAEQAREVSFSSATRSEGHPQPSTWHITKAHNYLNTGFLEGRPTTWRVKRGPKRDPKCELGHGDNDACQPRAKLISNNNSDLTLHVTTLLESIPAWRKTVGTVHAGTTSWFRGVKSPLYMLAHRFSCARELVGASAALLHAVINLVLFVSALMRTATSSNGCHKTSPS